MKIKVSQENGQGGVHMSCMGLFCTVVFVALSAVFLYTRIELLIDANKEVEPIEAPVPPVLPNTIVQSSVDGGLSSDAVFNADQGLFLAFTLTGGTSFAGDYPNIVTPVAMLTSWGQDVNGDYTVVNTQLNLHPCTQEELGLSTIPSDLYAYPINPNDAATLDSMKESLVCLDREEVETYGNWNTQSAQIIEIQYQLCSESPDCKSDQEIEDFMEGQYIALLHNQIRLNPDNYQEGELLKESRISFIPAVRDET